MKTMRLRSAVGRHYGRLVLAMLAAWIVTGCSSATPPPWPALAPSSHEAGWWLTESLINEPATSDGAENLEVIRIKADVFFRTGSSELVAEETERLDGVARLIATGGQPVIIVGHTDDIGAAIDNQQLGQERADAVRGHLVSISGRLDELVILTDSRGESCPLEPNDSPEGRAANRRVEIFTSGNEPECDAATG